MRMTATRRTGGAKVGWSYISSSAGSTTTLCCRWRPAAPTALRSTRFGSVRFPSKARSRSKYQGGQSRSCRARKRSQIDSGLSPISFDHLVGKSQQRRRKTEAKVFGGLEVQNEFELARLLEGQLAGPGSAQEAGRISREPAIDVLRIDAI